MQKEDRKSSDNSFGIASVVLGIVGSVLGILVLPVVISIVGLIFGIIQLKKAKNNWAIWGIVLSVLGIIISGYVLWQLMALSSQLQQTLTLCQADPTAPGCADILKFAGVQ